MVFYCLHFAFIRYFSLCPNFLHFWQIQTDQQPIIIDRIQNQNWPIQQEPIIAIYFLYILLDNLHNTK